MTVNPTAVWRVRPGGNNTNGGGFDCSISSAATGTNGSLSFVTFTDTVAAAFTSGMAGSAINISGVGQFLIATYVSATQITLAVGAGGSLPQLPGGAAWTVGAGHDYSQQNAAQASGSHGTATGTATFIDATANAFTAAMVGNCIQIASGAGFTAGFYFVTAYTSASTVTLDRSPGTGTVAVWALGGGWADFWTNTTSSGPLVPGNIVYILGSGTPNPSSYTYDYTNSSNNNAYTNGNYTNGIITYANDPETPGYKSAPDTTGGMPVLSINGYAWDGISFAKFVGLWIVFSGTGPANVGAIYASSSAASGCVFDQNGFDVTCVNGINLIGCEVFSSVAPGSSGSNVAVSSPVAMFGCNVHDTVGHGVESSTTVVGCIIAKCRGDGLYYCSGFILNNTIDGNLGHGIGIPSQYLLNYSNIFNNVISNHTQAGKYGMTVFAGTASQNDLVKLMVDYNTFYNNTTDVNAISYGPHATHGGSNPYVSQSTENYTLV